MTSSSSNGRLRVAAREQLTGQQGEGTFDGLDGAIRRVEIEFDELGPQSFEIRFRLRGQANSVAGHASTTSSGNTIGGAYSPGGWINAQVLHCGLITSLLSS